MATISDIEGIGPVNAEKLQGTGVKTVEALLEWGASAAGRNKLSDKTGISTSQLLEWVNRADLYRIKGVGQEFSDLLEAADVDTVVELATRNPENLYEKLVETNKAKKLVRAMPSESQVADFIEQAKSLPRVVTH